jgi:hypothetical protein
MSSVPAEFRAWHDLDWRFLLADPTLARVWLDDESGDERANLTAAGIAVSEGTAAGVDIAFVHGHAFHASSLEEALPPGTLVRFAIAPKRRRLALLLLRPWTSRRNELRSRGWQVLGCFWAAPELDGAGGYADIGDASAVRRLLRMTHRQRSWRGKLKIGAVLAATWVGLTELVCREGIMLARTPE